MNIKLQEYRFVEWSKGLSAETYDVKKINSLLATKKDRSIRVADVGGGIGMLAAVIADAIENSFVDE